MSIDSTTFSDLSTEQRKIAYAVYNKMTSTSIDFSEKVMGDDDNVLMVSADGTEAGYQPLKNMKASILESIGEDFNGNYVSLKNLPTINGEAISGDYLLGEGLGIQDKAIALTDKYVRRVRVATTAQWAVEPTYIPDEGQFIIYSDYMTVNGMNYAGIKIGDGNLSIANLPYLHGEILSELESHINDLSAHVSADDREYWNGKNKVSETVQNETLLITL